MKKIIASLVLTLVFGGLFSVAPSGSIAGPAPAEASTCLWYKAKWGTKTNTGWQAYSNYVVESSGGGKNFYAVKRKETQRKTSYQRVQVPCGQNTQKHYSVKTYSDRYRHCTYTYVPPKAPTTSCTGWTYVWSAGGPTYTYLYSTYGPNY